MPGRKKSRKISHAESKSEVCDEPPKTSKVAAVSPEKKPQDEPVSAIVYTKKKVDAMTFPTRNQRDDYFRNLPIFMVTYFGLEPQDFESNHALDDFLSDFAANNPGIEDDQETTDYDVAPRTPTKEVHGESNEPNQEPLTFDVAIIPTAAKKPRTSTVKNPYVKSSDSKPTAESKILTNFDKRGGGSQVEVIIWRFKNIPDEATVMPIILDFHSRGKQGNHWLHKNYAFTQVRDAWIMATDDNQLDDGVPRIPNCFRHMTAFKCSDGNEKLVNSRRSSWDNYWECLFTFVKVADDSTIHNRAIAALIIGGVEVIFSKGSPFREIYSRFVVRSSQNPKILNGVDPEKGPYFDEVLLALKHAQVRSLNCLKDIFVKEDRDKIIETMFDSNNWNSESIRRFAG